MDYLGERETTQQVRDERESHYFRKSCSSEFQFAFPLCFKLLCKERNLITAHLFELVDEISILEQKFIHTIVFCLVWSGCKNRCQREKRDRLHLSSTQ